MFQFKQNEATADRRRIFFYAVNSTDGYTAVTASITSGVVLIVKNGNMPGTSITSPTFTHVSNGLWYYEMTAGHLDTQGVVSVTITGTNIRTVQLIGYVYSGDPMAAIPTFPTNFSNLAITVGGAVTAGTVGDKTGYGLASGAITSGSFAAGAINAAAIATDAIGSDELAASATAEIADAILARNLDSSGNEASTTSSGRTVRNALRILRNKVDASSGTQVDVYNEADTSVIWSQAITTSVSADPIVKVGT